MAHEDKPLRAAEELEDLRGKYQALISKSLFCTFVADLQGNFLEANDAALSLLGYKRKDISRLNYASLIAEESDLVRAFEVLEGLLRDGASRAIPTYRLKRKDGGIVWVETEASLLRRRGVPVAVYGIARNITRQREAEEVLRQSEERFRELAELLPEIIFELDLMGVVTFLNQKGLEISGYTQADVEQGFYGAWFFAPEERQRVIANILHLMQGREVGVSEFTAIRKDGSRFPVMIRATPIFRNDRVAGLRGIIVDITEHKQLEEELQQQQEHLQELVEERTAELRMANTLLEQEIAERREVEGKLTLLNEQLEERVRERTSELEGAYAELQRLDALKDTFLSLVSHELRTPLTSIGSFSEILLNYENEDPATRREFLEIIHTETERLTRLINDVLDLSKIEAGRMVYHDDLICLDDVIHDAVKLQTPLMRQRSLRLRLDLCPDTLVMDADRDRIQQVLTNLLNNAIKFSLEGGEIEVRTEAFVGKRAGEISQWIKVSVSDQGIGIDEQEIPLIFEKFSQSSTDTLKERPKGTGLGLPICREIIRHYGGNIWVESKKGQGSTFFFTLPRSPVRKEVFAEAAPACRETGKLGKTILVVDDNPNIRRLLRYHFAVKGCEVLEAADGLEAIRVAQHARVDLITLDLIMPIMNGYDVLGILRDDPRTRKIPVLILSMVEDREKGLLLGANDYLAKPFHETELIDKVEALLGRENRSVLVVDDNPGIRETLRTRLEVSGYTVSVAEDGAEAVRLLQGPLPGLVILDLMMPKMNGYEVLNWMRTREETRRLPVIILSSYKISPDQREHINQWIDAYVQKSDDLSLLFDRVEAILRAPSP